jgi:hypothetical protein
MDVINFKNEILRKIDDLYNIISRSGIEMIRLWRNHILFTWQWWLSLALTVFPWILWVLLRKKSSTFRLLFSAFFVIII